MSISFIKDMKVKTSSERKQKCDELGTEIISTLILEHISELLGKEQDVKSIFDDLQNIVGNNKDKLDEKICNDDKLNELTFNFIVDIEMFIPQLSGYTESLCKIIFDIIKLYNTEFHSQYIDGRKIFTGEHKNLYLSNEELIKLNKEWEKITDKEKERYETKAKISKILSILKYD